MHGFKLTHALLFRVSGKDSTRYLHNRLTNDIRSLPIGGSCEVAGLSPQGKLEFLGGVLRTGEQEYFLLLDGGEPQVVEAAFRRYLVADRVEVERCKDWQLAHVLDASLPKARAIARVRLGNAGYDVLATSAAELPTYLELTTQAVFKSRVEAGIAAFPEELDGDVLFSEAALPRAISFNKGCYVGQEVVERISALGKPPRLLRPFSAAATPLMAKGDEILGVVEGKRKLLGEIISVGADELQQYGFALVRNISAENLVCGATNLTIKF